MYLRIPRTRAIRTGATEFKLYFQNPDIPKASKGAYLGPGLDGVNYVVCDLDLPHPGVAGASRIDTDRGTSICNLS